MADLTFTTIEESARHSLNISRDEYAACNYIQTWAAFPSNNTPGVCNRTRGQMAAFIGISERGLQKMLSRLEGLDLIKRTSQSQFLYRITEKWFDVVVSAKAERTGEQSSRQGVNKVHPHKELNKEVKTTTVKSVDVVDASLSNLEEKEIPPSPVPPPPSPSTPGESAPRRFDAFDIDSAAVELKENTFSAENFARITGTPSGRLASVFTSEVDVFVLEQKGKKTVYNRFDQFSSHFFNYVRAKARDRRSVPSQSQAPSNIPSALQGLIGK